MARWSHTLGGLARLLGDHRWLTGVILVLGLLASLAEGVGISLFLPLLQMLGEDSGGAAGQGWLLDRLTAPLAAVPPRPPPGAAPPAHLRDRRAHGRAPVRLRRAPQPADGTDGPRPPLPPVRPALARGVRVPRAGRVWPRAEHAGVRDVADGRGDDRPRRPLYHGEHGDRLRGPPPPPLVGADARGRRRPRQRLPRRAAADAADSGARGRGDRGQRRALATDDRGGQRHADGPAVRAGGLRAGPVRPGLGAREPRVLPARAHVGPGGAGLRGVRGGPPGRGVGVGGSGSRATSRRSSCSSSCSTG